MSALRVAAAGVLATIGVIHIAWGAGSPWPARSRSELARQIIGNSELPPPAACYAVAAVALTASAAVAARRPAQRRSRLETATIIALAARALIGGRTTLKLLRLPAPHSSFVVRDALIFRPLCAAVAVGLILDDRARSRAPG